MPRFRHSVQENPVCNRELKVVVEKRRPRMLKLSIFGKCRPRPLVLNFGALARRRGDVPGAAFAFALSTKT
jgi:hypothetical protein